MSADPEVPVDDRRYTGGHVLRNTVMSKEPGNNLCVLTTWRELGTYEANQRVVPPAQRQGLPKHHPCRAANEMLLRCSAAQPTEMKLAGRCALCWKERQELMTCLVRARRAGVVETEEDATTPWYRVFWK